MQQTAKNADILSLVCREAVHPSNSLLLLSLLNKVSQVGLSHSHLTWTQWSLHCDSSIGWRGTQQCAATALSSMAAHSRATARAYDGQTTVASWNSWCFTSQTLSIDLEELLQQPRGCLHQWTSHSRSHQSLEEHAIIDKSSAALPYARRTHFFIYFHVFDWNSLETRLIQLFWNVLIYIQIFVSLDPN